MANIRRQQGEVEIKSGYVIDQKSGLVVPNPYHGKGGSISNKGKIGGLIGQRLAEMGLHNIFNPSEGYYTYGYYLDRQEGTAIPYFHRKGSIESELLLSAIADGEVGNVGITPVVWPLLNAVLQNQIAKTQSITMNITGKMTPVSKVANSLARFNDSPLGFLDSLKKLVYGYRVFNRGQPVSTIPFHFDISQYDDYGMDLQPIDEEKNQYYLQVDWDRVRDVIPFLPDPLRCIPTGNVNWPYWYNHKNVDNKSAWILLHKSHIIPVIPGESLHTGIGTSALWVTLGFLSDHFLVVEERAEKKLNKLTSGFIGISGTDLEADEVRADLELAKEQQENEGQYFGSEYVIFTSDDRTIQFAFLPLRQGDGVDDKFREENYQDILAQAFQEPLAAIAMRGGMGLGSRMSEDSADQQAEVGVATVLNAVSHTLECIFNTVEIAIVQPNNRAKRLNVKTFSEFTKGVNSLPEGLLSNEEIRAIINRDILEIPSVDEETTQTTDGNDPITDPNGGNDPAQEDDIENQKLVSTLTFTIRYFEPFIPDGANNPIPQSDPDSDAVTDQNFDQNFPEYEGMLSAVNWDDPDQEEPAQPVQDDTAWYWQFALLEFLRQSIPYSRKVQRVPRGETQEIRDGIAQFAIDDNDTLATELGLGNITIQDWVTTMQSIVQDDFTQAFLIGIGGRDNLTPNDTIWLNNLLLERFREIEALGADIAQGLYSEAQIANYGRNIVSGSVAAYEAGNSTNYGLILGLIELPEYPATIQICRGNCRCHWDLRRDGNLVYATWTLDPKAQHCPSCLENANRWDPLIIDLEL